MRAKGAPKGRIVKVDCSAPGNALVEIVPEGEHPLESASMVGGRLLCHYLVDARNEVVVYEATGAFVQKVPLPDAGSVSGMGGRQRNAETFLSYSSFAVPGVIYRYDVQAGALEEVRRREVDLDIDDYAVEQVFFESRDRTRVPLFVVPVIRKQVFATGSRTYASQTTPKLFIAKQAAQHSARLEF